MWQENVKVHHYWCYEHHPEPVLSTPTMHPHHFSPYNTLIFTFTSNFLLGILSLLLLRGFPIKIHFTFLVSSVLSTFTAYRSLLYFTTLAKPCHLHKQKKSSLFDILSCSLTSSLDPNIFLETLFSGAYNFQFFPPSDKITFYFLVKHGKLFSET